MHSLGVIGHLKCSLFLANAPRYDVLGGFGGFGVFFGVSARSGGTLKSIRTVHRNGIPRNS